MRYAIVVGITARALVFAIAVCSLAALASAQEVDVKAAPPGSVQRETEALTARIARLERFLGVPGQDGRGTASIDAASTVVPTAGAGEAGSKAQVGAGDAAAVLGLMKLVQKREPLELTKELGKLLAQGDPARATLHDFLKELDGDPRQALVLTYDYRFSFSLFHLAVLHKDELAKLAHYFFAATMSSPRSTLRRTLFDYLPELLRFHRGRYPDLEKDFKKEILRQLNEPNTDHQLYFRAMESLGFKPPLEVFEPLLAAASSHAETLPVALHLQAADTSEAVEILTRGIDATPPGFEWKSAILLGSLARMSSPEAPRALAQYMGASNEMLLVSAYLAYFGVPRDKSSISKLLELLNGPVELNQKHAILQRVHQANPELFAVLRADLNVVKTAEVRDLITREHARELKPQEPKR